MRVATVWIVLLIAMAGLAGCAKPDDDPVRGDIDHFGVTLSPRAYRGPDLEGFFSEAERVGDTVAWSGDWIHIYEQGSAPDFLANGAAEERLDTMVLPTFFRPHDGALLRPLNNTTRTFYVGAAETFAQVHRPDYLGFGVEINLLWERNQSAAEDFASWWPRVYDVVKRASPDTTVFPVFQYERMIGLRRALANDTAETDPQWHLLDLLEPRDAIGFTTFPGLVYGDPAEIPRSHYAALDGLNERILITETGWHNSDVPPGWESSDAEQTDYVGWFLSRVPEVEAVVWSALYDAPGAPPFDAMGLVNEDRTPRPAWHAWRAHAKPAPP